MVLFIGNENDKTDMIEIILRQAIIESALVGGIFYNNEATDLAQTAYAILQANPELPDTFAVLSFNTDFTDVEYGVTVDRNGIKLIEGNIAWMTGGAKVYLLGDNISKMLSRRISRLGISVTGGSIIGSANEPINIIMKK